MPPEPTTPNTEKGPKPQYQVLERCYLPVEGPGGTLDRILDPSLMPFKKFPDGTQKEEREPLVITYTGVPAHYLKPLNAAAKKMCEQHADRMTFNDPINKLTVVGADAPTPAA